MQSTPILATPPLPPWLKATRRPFHTDLYAFYSSVTGGITTEPLLMQVPIDDHLVHRGDGVFETIKCVEGRIFCLNEHLDRLFYSAQRINLAAPASRDTIRARILDTIRVAAQPNHLVRVILSRGTGSMGINPYDCPSAHLYILVHKAAVPFMETHPNGARLVTSAIPVKAGMFANIKTCNYLPNALLKKEAVDRGADFSVNFDENGFIAEGATENIGIVTRDRHLVIPRPERILAGTTMQRAFALADQGQRDGWLAGKHVGDLTRNDLVEASEILIFGTTTNVTAVTECDGSPVNDGKPGPVQTHLSKLLIQEQTSDNPYTTRAFT